MRPTGEFLTDEELEEVQELHQKARNTPAMAMSVHHGIERGGFAGEAWGRMHERLDGLAEKHGLPPLEDGHYGVKPDGELVAPS